MDGREELKYSSSQVNAGVEFVLCGEYYQATSGGTNTIE
jgi:hypothetical protein